MSIFFQNSTNSEKSRRELFIAGLRLKIFKYGLHQLGSDIDSILRRKVMNATREGSSHQVSVEEFKLDLTMLSPFHLVVAVVQKAEELVHGEGESRQINDASMPAKCHKLDMKVLLSGIELVCNVVASTHHKDAVNRRSGLEQDVLSVMLEL